MPSTPAHTENRLLFPILLIICSGMVLLANIYGTIFNVVIFGAILFVSAFYISYKFPRYNIFFLLGAGFMVPFFIKAFRLYGIPIGTAIEGLCFILILTLILNRRLSGFMTLPGVLLMIWIMFQALELINPIAYSREASILAFRGIIPLITAFLVVYSSTDTKRDAYLLIGAWFFFSLLAGLYGLYQEFAGLPEYDFKWASADERRFQLLFTWGRMRKFSFFFSPSELGMIMALSAVGGFIIVFFVKRTGIRIMSALTGVVCLFAMIYTGSRTAMVMLPVGFMLFAIITLHPKVWIAVGCFILVGAVLILRPSSSRALFVMSTAFNAQDDPSMNVRFKNQEMVRSYIRSHPIGFGLGSTGELGMKYAPHTFIGSFPPDSEYVEIAIESGWIGLFIWCVMLAILFGYGIVVYFRIKDPEWRVVLTLCLVVFYMMIVAQYPQEFFRSPVLTVLFSALIALVAKIDKKIPNKSGISNSEEL